MPVLGLGLARLWDMGSIPKLTVEIIPTSLHGKNPRSVMGRAMWERERKLVCEAAGNRCEICGGVGKRHPVEIHERYEYDETCAPPCQRVVGLIALCPNCHAVKHLARTRMVAVQQGDPVDLRERAPTPRASQRVGRRAAEVLRSRDGRDVPAT